MPEAQTSSTAWNGQFSMVGNEYFFWQIGPFQLWVSRLPSELRIAFKRGTESFESTLVVEVPSSRTEAPEGTDVRRFGFSKLPESLELVPALADRPVVVCPEDPLTLPPHEETTLFISTPLWVKVMAGTSTSPLLDQPTHRPTDTWFGASTMEGELCYATRTNARMNLENVPVRPHRAISVVRIKNGTKTDLNIEKLKLPTLQMSVYVTEDGHFWTEGVTLERQGEDETAAVRLGKGPPHPARNATLATGSRIPLSRSVLTRAFAGFLRT